MEVRNRYFSCFIDQFTPNTFVCIVTNSCDIPRALVKKNIQLAKPVFERLERESMQMGSGAAAAGAGASANQPRYH